MIARIFTLIFILSAYIGPEKLFGSLVLLHIQVLIGGIAILVSIPGSLRHIRELSPQFVAMLGLIAAVFVSLVAIGWFGGAVMAVDIFLPQAITYFLVLFNFKTKRQIQVLIAGLLAVSFFIIYSGHKDLQAHKVDSPYLIAQNNAKGETFYRLRGETFIGDPNDFAQLLVCLIPLAFFFWRKKKKVSNVLLVYIPVAILVFGMYLTHSRGGILALVATLLFAGRKRLGMVPSAVLAALAFMGATAMGWTGGRDISVGSGEDRMDAWAEGLQLIKHNPFFGVGYNQFTEHYYITAHNTVVVCAAELGIFGFFFWVLFVVPTVIGNWRVANSLTSKRALTERHAVDDSSVSISLPDSNSVRTPQEATEISRMGELLLLTMVGFLTASWFLSRSYVMTLFVFGALSQVVYNMAEENEVISEKMTWERTVKLTLVATIGLLIAVYIFLRIGNLGR